MKYSELITTLRYELADADKTEWTDDALFDFLKRSERRIRNIVIKNGFAHGRKAYSFDTVVDQGGYDLPSNFDVQCGLYRQDTKKELRLLEPCDWETLSTQSTPTFWFLDDDGLAIKGVPSTVISMNLYYYPVYTTPTAVSDEMFFGNKYTDTIMLYAAFIAKNIDEMDARVDLQMLKEIEVGMVETYQRNRGRRANVTNQVYNLS